MAIEPIEFSWMEIENIVRNVFPDPVKQRKLPDKNSFSDIHPMPAPGSDNHLQPFPLTQDHSNNSDRAPQSKEHA